MAREIWQKARLGWDIAEEGDDDMGRGAEVLIKME